jgi:SUZ domain
MLALFFFPISTSHLFLHSPSKRISELVPVEQSKQPAFKIMSRSVDRIRAQSQSRTGSVNGEDAESSDVEPSEAGSIGGRNNAQNRQKKALTMEEREAAYNEARSRIFMDFEDKAKDKENDMSASSSTFSLVSGSASTSGGGSSSAGDIEDSISTAPTESEFSGPVAREPKSERRNGSGANSAGSSRSMLPPKHPSSSRGSRAPSPSFTYASIYDSAPNTVPYDAGQAPPIPQPYAQSFMYPYSPPPPPGQGPAQNFMPPVPYYSYGYAQSPPPLPPPQHHTSNSDPSGSTPDPQTPGLFVPSQQMVYMPPYPWPPNPAPGVPSVSHTGAPLLPPSHPSQYQFPPPSTQQYGGYNIPTFYPTMHSPAKGQQPLQQPTHPVNMAPLPQGNEFGIRVMPPTIMNNDHVDPSGRKRGNSRNGPQSYGPGFGYPFGLPGGTVATSPVENHASPVGPRLNNSMRRPSGTSNGSRTPGDEASSVTVSGFYVSFLLNVRLTIPRFPTC